MESTESSTEFIITVNKGNISGNGNNWVEERAEDVEEHRMKVLCVVWRNGNVGAAYYDFADKLLYIYEEVVDPAPQFFMTGALFREIMPDFVLTFGVTSEDYIKHVIDTMTLREESSTSTDTVRAVPPNLFLLPKKEYSFETCKMILSHLTLDSDSASTELERELHIHSLVNLDDKTSVYAIGALIKYLDKNWAHFTRNRENLHFLHINQVSLKAHLLTDCTTLNALQVFHQFSHDSNFKRGLQNANREALSIYKLFSSNCKSKLGLALLRNVLTTPLNDINELNKRLDFINFVLHPTHHEFVQSLQDNIKDLGDIHLILSRIQHFRADSRDWNNLYKAIYHAIFIHEISAPYAEECEFLAEFCNCITPELMGLENSINNALDFATNNGSFRRPIIKYGLDQQLDAKKLRRQDIGKHVTAAAKIAVNQLPDYLDECAIVYLPEMGHLIAIKEWEPGCNPEQLEEFGFQFMFMLRGTIHYKNPMCVALDGTLGDISAEIIAHENRILQRLSLFVIKYNRDIREPLKMLALMDILISMGKVASQNNYVRPLLNEDNIHEIQECRHPILEIFSQFETNDFYSGGNHSRIKIITGPNGSGKSVYLKQAAFVMYLAHIGSYVPAKSANIGMLHSIHSRLQTTESVSVRLSGFMIDVKQATQALHNAKANSLVLLDEFGRGTIEEEGFALLVGLLQTFSKNGHHCPHILIATHYQKISEYLPQSALVDHLQMEHSMENDVLIYPFKLKQGVSSSFALDIAADTGLDPFIIRRAREFLAGGIIKPLSNISRSIQKPNEETNNNK